MQRMSGFPATNDVLTGPNRPAVRSWKRPVDALELELGTCMSWLPWLRWHPLGSIWACGSIQWVLIMWRIYMDLLSKLWSHLCNESPSYRTHQNSTIHHGFLRHSLIFFSMPRWYQQRQGRGLSELRNGGKWINLKVLNVLRCIETYGISRQRRCTRMPRFLSVFVRFCGTCVALAYISTLHASLSLWAALPIPKCPSNLGDCIVYCSLWQHIPLDPLASRSQQRSCRSGLNAMLHHCCETGADQETSPAVSLLHFSYRWWQQFNNYHDGKDEYNCITMVMMMLLLMVMKSTLMMVVFCIHCIYMYFQWWQLFANILCTSCFLLMKLTMILMNWWWLQHQISRIELVKTCRW